MPSGAGDTRWIYSQAPSSIAFRADVPDSVQSLRSAETIRSSLQEEKAPQLLIDALRDAKV